jgi:hypothetical protein
VLDAASDGLAFFSSNPADALPLLVPFLLLLLLLLLLPSSVVILLATLMRCCACWL